MRTISTTSIATFEPGVWDTLVPDTGFYCSHAWLQSQEAAAWAHETYHLTLANDGHPLAAAVTQRFDPGQYGFPEHVEEPDRAMLVGGRTGYHNELLREHSPEGRSAWTALLTKILQQAHDDGVGRVVLDFVPGPVVCWLAERFQVEAALRDVAAEVLGASDLTSYLSGFDRKRRVQMRSEISKFEAAYDLRVRRLHQCVDEVAPLVARTLEKYGAPYDLEGVRSFLKPQAEALGGRAHVVSCHEEDGTTVGAVIGFEWRDAIYMRVAGFDYPRLKRAFEYFNLTYYQPLKLLKGPWHRVHLGPGSLDAKLRRGARPYALWAATIDPARGQMDAGTKYVETEEGRRTRHEIAAFGLPIDDVFRQAGLECPQQ